MPTEGREKGIRSPYSVRFGPSNPYSGKNTEADAASLPDTQGVEAINVRIVGGRPVSRPGQEKVNVSTIAPIHGFHDATSDAAADPYSPLGNTVYFTGFHTDLTTRALFRFDAEAVALTVGPIAPVFNGTIPYYVTQGLMKGSDSQVYLAGGLYDPVALTTQAFVAQVNLAARTFTSLWSLGAVAAGNAEPVFRINCLLEDPAFALKFYAGIPASTYDGSIAAPGVLYRDGTLEDTVTLLYSNTQSAPPSPVYFNGRIYVMWGADTIRKRLSAGSWTSLTPPSPPNPGEHFYSFDGADDHGLRPAVFDGRLYFGVAYQTALGVGADYCLLSVTTADVVAIARNLGPGGTSAAPRPFLFNGYLYYFGHGTLGRFDGSSWTDSHWNCEIAGSLHELIDVSPYVADGQSVYALAVEVSSGDEWIIKSDGTDTTTWTRVLENTTGSFFGYADMVAVEE